MKNITLKVFVVPNPAVVFDGCSGNGPVNAPNSARMAEQFGRTARTASKFGMTDLCCQSITASTFWAHVWVYDETDDNLTDHGFGTEHPLLEVAEYAPGLMTEEFLRKVAKSGEAGVDTVVKYNMFGGGLDEEIHITWIGAQQTSRYRDWGTLEEALDAVIEKCKRYEKPEVKAAYEAYLKAYEEAEAARKL